MTTYDDYEQSGNDITYWWENVANTRWGNYTSDIEKRCILKGNDLCREPTAALDIGCACGKWSKLLADLGWNVTCTDINEKRLKICQKRIPTTKCILVSPNETKLPCVSESIDLLLCIEVGAVIQADWFINEAFRVLKNDGIIVGVFLNLLSFRGLFAHMKASFTGSYNHYKIAYPSWRRNLLNRGFFMLYEEGYCWFPFSRISNSVFVPYFARLEKILGLHKLASISPWTVFIARKTLKNT